MRDKEFKVLLSGPNHSTIQVKVRVNIDEAWIITRMARIANRSKAKKASALHDAIRVEVIS